MQMDGWADHLHTSFYGEHVLLPGLRLTSFGTFLLAAALAASICLTERSLTFALAQHWAPFRAARQSRVHNALWRAGLHALAILLRLLYMLLSMTFHVWLIFVIVLSLSVGQFFIEYYDSHNPTDYRNAYQQLSISSSPPRMRRVRGRIKPAGLFIHPNNSNIARADAVALELGLHDSPERVKAVRRSSDSDDGSTMWMHGRGREVAHALLGNTHQKARKHSHAHMGSDSEQKPFQVGESGSESEG